MAKRHRISTDAFRRYNKLGAKTRKLRRRSYVVYQSPFHNVRLQGGVLLTAIDGVVEIQRPQRGWGRPILVSSLRVASLAVQRAFPLQPWLIMGDLSKEGGGCLPPHRSHRGGLDVDVGYYHLGGKQRGWLDHASTGDIDADRTWAYVSALMQTGAMQFAFVDYSLQPQLYAAALRSGETTESLRPVFQFPRPKEQTKASIIRHLDGHADHIHLRLRCLDPSCDLPEEAAARIVRAIGAERGGPVREGRRAVRHSARRRPRTLRSY